MTEAEWNACTDPAVMLAFLRDNNRATNRKLWLFAVTCCRRILPLLVDNRSRAAVLVAEQYADGRAGLDELRAAAQAAIEATWAAKDEEDARWPAEPMPGRLEAAEAAEMASSAERTGQPWGADGGYAA